ncbi:MAG: hypothetical protein AAF502_01130 [Bacteroidota bacterium]
MKTKTALFNRKIFDVLKVLSRNEINEFGRFLGTTVFKCDEEVLKLFGYLKPYHPEFEPGKISEKKMIKKVFGNTTSVSGRKIDKKVSALILLAEKYLLSKHLDTPSEEKKLLLARIYSQRQADQLFFRLMDKVNNQVNRKTAPETLDYFYKTRSSYESYFHPSKVKFEKRISNEQLKRAIEHHKDYFVVGMLRLAVEAVSRRYAAGEDIAVPLLKEVRILAANIKPDNPLVNLYSLILFHAEHSDDASLNTAEELFRTYHDHISPSKQNTIVSMLINFSLIQYASGREEHQLKVFMLYQLAFENQWLEVEGFIPESHFTRAIFIAVDLKQFSWVEKTLDNAEQTLRSDIKQNTILICQAYLSFGYEKFEEVLDYLRQAEFPNINYELNSRSLILKSYYELNIGEREYPVVDYCESYRQYLMRRKNIPAVFIERNLNFIKMVRRLTNAHAENREDLQRELLYRIERMPIISKGWLLEKINQLYVQ